MYNDCCSLGYPISIPVDLWSDWWDCSNRRRSIGRFYCLLLLLLQKEEVSWGWEGKGEREREGGGRERERYLWHVGRSHVNFSGMLLSLVDNLVV